MSNIPKILVIAEGKRDSQLFNKLLKTYGIKDHEIISYKTNIYSFYNDIFIDDEAEEIDLLALLRSREKNSNNKDIFFNKYTDILLVFDFDPQDNNYDCNKLDKLSRYFCESTDKGKLYINYPMLESFYHISKPIGSLTNSKTKRIDFSSLSFDIKNHYHSYKESVNCCDFKKYAKNKAEFTAVIIQNYLKYLNIVKHIDNYELLEKDVFKYDGCLTDLLKFQADEYNRIGYVYVLCSSIFFILEYNWDLVFKK